MKILISALGKESKDLLDSRFGRCDYFQVFNTETNEYKVLENEGVKSSQGAGIAASQQVIDEGVDVVITGKLGPNAFNILNDANLELYSCSEISIEDAIKSYKEGKLEVLSKSGPSRGGMKR